MTTLLHHLAGLIGQYGIPAVFLAVSLESMGVPLPGEGTIVIASAAAGAGDLDIRLVVLTALVAAVLGDNLGYLIGRKLGRPVILRYGARFGATECQLARAEGAAARHGPLMVIFARFFVVLRQLNGVVAGLSRMRWRVFLAANAIGAALWVGLWSALAYRFGLTTEALPFIWHHLYVLAAILGLFSILALTALFLRSRRHPR
ncbi:MAG: DedA family protein [Thiohalocapsa sp.]|uniref:DedA family protein n=1 Tax=Thiohalocapsa sp. TaxID=2497641 RepID=UPI0025FA2285|nr:DedA family protein [Thiohalocapsa sp.]MCG6940208.1 DedA family protein [Thiohalocapsa sp.]